MKLIKLIKKILFNIWFTLLFIVLVVGFIGLPIAGMVVTALFLSGFITG